LKGADKFWARVPHTKTRKNVHIVAYLPHMVRMHLICVIAEEYIYSRCSKCPPCINVWAGIAGDCLVGPHILQHQLTCRYYEDFLLHNLPDLLEDVPLAVRAQMWYMLDGPPAYFSCAVRDVLSNTCHE
jgi:hypothetical protein